MGWKGLRKDCEDLNRPLFLIRIPDIIMAKKDFVNIDLKGKISDFIRNPHIPWFLMESFNRLSLELKEWLMTFVMALPGRAGSFIRTTVIPFKTVGRKVRLMGGGFIEYPSQLTIGENTQINRNCFINAGGGVDIGKNVLIGPHVIIYSQNHNYGDSKICISDQGYTKAKVVIEDDVWLCARSTILPGLRVRKGTVVAAGAVVTKDTEPYSVVAGIPAIKIGQRY